MCVFVCVCVCVCLSQTHIHCTFKHETSVTSGQLNRISHGYLSTIPHSFYHQGCVCLCLCVLVCLCAYHQDLCAYGKEGNLLDICFSCPEVI